MRTYRVESRQQEETRNEAHAGPKRASAREAGEVWDHAAALWRASTYLADHLGTRHFTSVVGLLFWISPPLRGRTESPDKVRSRAGRTSVLLCYKRCS